MIAAVGDGDEEPLGKLMFEHAGDQLHSRRVEPLHVLAHEEGGALLCEPERQAGQDLERATPAGLGAERHLRSLNAGLEPEQLADHLGGVRRRGEGRR